MMMAEIKAETKREVAGNRVKFVQKPKPPDPAEAKLAEIDARAQDGKLNLQDIYDLQKIILEEIKAVKR
jgi:hypothetical protein